MAVTTEARADRCSLMRDLRGTSLAGAAVIAGFFGGLGGWAAMVPLAGAAIAPGVISPDGSRRTVQHLEGGIVRDILVRDGSLVRKDDPLLTLQDVQARASLEVLETQRRVLAATQARLLAEQAGADAMAFPAWLTDPAAAPGAQDAVQAQRSMFETRRDSQAQSKAILTQRTAQLAEEIAGLERQIEADGRQLKLLAEERRSAGAQERRSAGAQERRSAGAQERRSVQELYDKGLERKPRLLALKRAAVETEGDRAERTAEIARARQAIGENRIQILATDTRFLAEVNDTLAKVQSELAQVEERLATIRDVLGRTIVRAPVDGRVVNLRIRTQGGVIRAGEPILDLVPEHEQLIIDARLQPNDIDNVREGQPAQIVFTAYRQRALPKIHGHVSYVAADALADDRSGRPFYGARITVDQAQLAQLPTIRLVPGMQAETFIETSRRTALGYILQPFRESLQRAMRED